MKNICLLVLMLGCFYPSVLYADENKDLFELSVEELMQVEITSISKKKENLFDSAAAVYVITSEDIRRSGAKNIPDLLRMVPGVDVAQINSNQWAVSIRGFNDSLANKLLVLIDGISVYNTFFSGVLWSDVDYLLHDIERIEVIRGPGGAIWGANAVNGVINIITKNSKATQGGYLNVGVGNEEQFFTNLRYGGKIGQDYYYRFSGKFAKRDNFSFAEITQRFPSIQNRNELVDDAYDQWDSYRLGFRLDSDTVLNDSFKVIANAFKVDYNTLIDEIDFNSFSVSSSKREHKDSGFNILTSYVNKTQNSEYKFQFYYDFLNVDLDEFVNLKTHAIDFEFLHDFDTHFVFNHDLIWGLGFRIIVDSVDETFSFRVSDDSTTNLLFSAFFQDRIELYNDKLFLILGSKFEHNEFSGFEMQPNLRMLFSPNDQNRFWAGISRAVRTPSRVDDAVRLLSDNVIFQDANTGLPVVAVVHGSEDFDSESLLSFEFGYRSRPFNWLSLDVAVFYNHYEDIENFLMGDPEVISDPVNAITIPFIFENRFDADAKGFEVALTLNPLDYWQIKANYSFIDFNLDNQPGVGSPPPRFFEEAVARNKFKIQSFLSLPYNFELDSSLYWTDSLEDLDSRIDSVTRLDVRLGYKPKENVEISLLGQNLIDDEHLEFTDSIIGRASAIERSFSAEITLSF